MSLTIELNGKEVTIPANNRKVMTIVADKMKASGGEFTIADVTENYKKYYSSVLQGNCPTCHNEELRKGDKFCSVCGLEIDELEVLEDE